MSSDDARRAEATRGDHPPRGNARETCGGASRERATPPARAAARTRRAFDESIAFASKSSRARGRRSLVAFALVLATSLVLAAVPPVGAGLEKYQYMGAGIEHTCVVLDDGKAVCWGKISDGRLLGTSGGTSVDSPKDHPDVTCDFGTVGGVDLTVKSVSVGYKHSCAILSNDRVKCWGNNVDARLGIGITTSDSSQFAGDSLPYVELESATPTTPPFLAKEVVAGAKHSCAITTGDEPKLYCWGNNDQGQANVADTRTTIPRPRDAINFGFAPDGVVAYMPVSVSLGWSHTCAMVSPSDYTKPVVKCWGSNNKGQLGAISVGDRVAALQSPNAVVNFGLGRHAVQIVAGYESNCALLDNDEVKCWGSGDNGRLGNGATANVASTIDSVGVGCRDTSGSLQVCLKAKSLSLGTASARHYCAIEKDFETVKCWGHNTQGQLGIPSVPSVPSTQESSTPQDVDLKMLKSTDDTTLAASIVALTINGGPWASADTWSTEEADLYETDQKVMYLVNGECHTCAILADYYTIRCWGYNGVGQLGDGTNDHISDLPSVVQYTKYVNLGYDAINRRTPGRIPRYHNSLCTCPGMTPGMTSTTCRPGDLQPATKWHTCGEYSDTATTIHDNVYVSGRTVEKLNFSSVVTFNGRVELLDANALVRVDFSNVVSIREFLHVRENDALTSFAMDELVTVGSGDSAAHGIDVRFNDVLSKVSFAALTKVKGEDINVGNPMCTEINLPLMEQVNGHIILGGEDKNSDGVLKSGASKIFITSPCLCGTPTSKSSLTGCERVCEIPGMYNDEEDECNALSNRSPRVGPNWCNWDGSQCSNDIAYQGRPCPRPGETPPAERTAITEDTFDYCHRVNYFDAVTGGLSAGRRTIPRTSSNLDVSKSEIIYVCPTDAIDTATTILAGEDVAPEDDACKSNNGGCSDLVSCTPGVGGVVHCGACPPGYLGNGVVSSPASDDAPAYGCADVDECSTNNGGCGDSVACVNTEGGRACGLSTSGGECFANYGECDPLATCSDPDDDPTNGNVQCGACPSGYSLADGRCARVDACASSSCFAGVTCTPEAPPSVGYACGTCPSGYAGDGTSCVDIDECGTANGRCDLLTTCTNTPAGARTCSACPAGYFGSGETGCVAKTSSCAENNGGCDPLASCLDTGSGVSCGACPGGGGYSGTGATGCVDVDMCAPTNPCYLAVTCTDVEAPGAGFECGRCPQGMKGDGQTCELCTMSASITGVSTVESGTIARGLQNKIVTNIVYMEPACTNDEGYGFLWRIVDTSDGSQIALDASMTKSNTQQLFLPARTLPEGKTYAIRFDAFSKGNPAVLASANVILFVKASPLEAVVEGGSQIPDGVVFALGVAFTLDASESIDPDEESNPWSYQWECLKTVDATGDTTGALSCGSHYAAAWSNVAPVSVGYYAFRVTVSKGARSATATRYVHVVSGAANSPSVSIAPIPGGVVNAGARARLSATVTSTASSGTTTVAWTAKRYELTIDGAIDIASAVTVDLDAAGFLAIDSTTTSNLVLAPDALGRDGAALYSYAFAIDVSDANGVAKASIELRRNVPPVAGTIAALPANGIAAQTTFVIAVGGGWLDPDGHLPLMIRFTALVKGAPAYRSRLLQDYSPRKTWKGTLPGGSRDHGYVVTVSAQAMDNRGAVSPVKSVDVVVKWPKVPSERALTAASAEKLAAAESAFLNGESETALSHIANACDQMLDYKETQRDDNNLRSRRRRRGRALLESSSVSESSPFKDPCAPQSDMRDRAKQRSRMMNLTESAKTTMPSSDSFASGIADVTRRVLSDPCESTPETRGKGVDLVDALLADAETNALGDLSMSEEVSVNALGALSSAVAPAVPGYGDKNAALTYAKATDAAKTMMARCLDPTVEGESTISVVSPEMETNARRAATTTAGTDSAVVSVSGASTVEVSNDVLHAQGGSPMDMKLLSMNFDPHALNQSSFYGLNGATETWHVASVGGDVEIVLRHARVAATESLVVSSVGAGAADVEIRNPAKPVEWTLAVRRVLGADTCVAGRGGGPPARGPTRGGGDKYACRFFDAAKGAYETDGCATLPNPLPRGARAAWIEGAAENTAAFQSAGYDYSRKHASFLWKLHDAKMFFNGCEEREVPSLRAGAMRMRSWTGANCVAEDPKNAFGCYWRFDAQAFEGCGCVVARAATCLCDRVADVTVSEYKIDTVSLGELTSLSIGDALNTWRVFAVVGAMFFGSLLLASALHLRATRVKRRLLRRLVDPAKNRDLGFAVVQRVWTWHIDVQEMQFMFNATHRANDEDAVAAALLDDAEGDDAAAASKLEVRTRMLELEREGVEGDAAAADVARAVERRVEALKRDARTRAGLPSCDKMPTDRLVAAGVDPEAVDHATTEMDAEIDDAVGADVVTRGGRVGVEVYSRGGRTFYELSTTESIESSDARGKRVQTARAATRDAREDGTEIEGGDEREAFASASAAPRAIVEAVEISEAPSRSSRGNVGLVPVKQRRGWAPRLFAVSQRTSRKGDGDDEGETAMNEKRPGCSNAPPAPAPMTFAKIRKIYRREGEGGGMTWRRFSSRPPPLPPPPEKKTAAALPVATRNGETLCKVCGLPYVRFLIAFPMEAIRSKLTEWRDDRNMYPETAAVLPFGRAVGTAIAYAYLDVKNIVSHDEIGRRKYDAAQLPWVLPDGVTFPNLVEEFKLMMTNNLTKVGWMRRAMLWNIVSLRGKDGGWSPTDALAAVLKAAGPPTACASMPATGSDAPTLKTHHDAAVLTRSVPVELAKAARDVGWSRVERTWCTLLVLAACEIYEFGWVVNPWDESFEPYDIAQHGWTFVQKNLAGTSPEMADAVLRGRNAARTAVTAWRESHSDAIEGLRERRTAEAAGKKKDEKTRSIVVVALAAIWFWLTRPMLFARAAWALAKFAVHAYCEAHMFFRAFLAPATAQFTGAQRLVVQSSIYIMGLLICVWMYSSRATQCCVAVREALGCTPNVMDACVNVEPGEGCEVLMRATKRFLPPKWKCNAFPARGNLRHTFAVIGIQVIMMFPVRFVLSSLFAVGGGAVSVPHYKEAVMKAGMNTAEVLAAWCESFYEFFVTNAATGARGGSERGGTFAGAVKRTLMLCGLYQSAIATATSLRGNAPRERKYRTVEEITGEIEALARSADVATTDRDAPLVWRNSAAFSAARPTDFQFFDGSESFVKPWDHLKIGGDDRIAFGEHISHHASKPSQDDTSRSEGDEARDGFQDDVVLRWIVYHEKAAVQRAARTFSQDDMRSERRKYLRRVKTSSSRVLKLAWCLLALYWLVCCYLIIVYGVLIYRYMGAGEEGAYITTWGMTFLLVNFGLLSLVIVGRKAFYKTFYNTWRKMFTPHFELNAWYEAYLERVGGVLLERNADGSKGSGGAAAAVVAPSGASAKVAPEPLAPPAPHLPSPRTDQENDDDPDPCTPIDSTVKTRWSAVISSARAHANRDVTVDDLATVALRHLAASRPRLSHITERMCRAIEAAEVQHAMTRAPIQGIEENNTDVDTSTIVDDEMLEMVAEAHGALERMKNIESDFDDDRASAREKLLKRLSSELLVRDRADKDRTDTDGTGEDVRSGSREVRTEAERSFGKQEDAPEAGSSGIVFTFQNKE